MEWNKLIKGIAITIFDIVLYPFIVVAAVISLPIIMPFLMLQDLLRKKSPADFAPAEDKLTIASCDHNFAGFLQLIEEGARPGYSNEYNSVLLMTIAHSGVECAVWMAENAKKHDINLDYQPTEKIYSGNRNTPLILACIKGWDHTAIKASDWKKYRTRPIKYQPLRRTKENSLPIPGERERLSLIITALLENDANPNIQNSSGNTALHIAILKREIPSIEILLKHGARLDIRNNEGLLPEEMLNKDYSGIDEFLVIEGNSDAGHSYIHTLHDEKTWEAALEPIREIITRHKATPPPQPSHEQPSLESTAWRDQTPRSQAGKKGPKGRADL